MDDGAHKRKLRGQRRRGRRRGLRLVAVRSVCQRERRVGRQGQVARTFLKLLATLFPAELSPAVEPASHKQCQRAQRMQRRTQTTDRCP